jgi:polyhydroxybutyrate depolymerase
MGSSGVVYLDRNGWAALADREGFVALAPDGLPVDPAGRMSFDRNPRVWNNGQLPPDHPRARVDDVAFVRHMLADVGGLDPDRVYLAGHSSGGGMAFRLAAEADRFAALATVASHCWLPTLCLFGAADPLVPLAGGPVPMPWGGTQHRPPVRSTLDLWARALNCPPDPEERTEAGAHVVRYGPGRDGAAVTAYLLADHGHAWPGGQDGGLPAAFLGPCADGFDATGRIWRFFQSPTQTGASSRRA